MPRKQHLYHYIYKTTCLVNGKYYVGMHSTSNLEDGYIGSGKRLWLSIRKHGRENFKFEILEMLPDRSSLKSREEELVNEDLLQDPLCMNLAKGGEGGFRNYEAASAGGLAIKQKLKEDQEFAKEWSRICSKRNLKLYDEGVLKSPSWLIDYWKGRNLSEEHRKSISKSLTGTRKGEKNSQYGTCFVNKEGKNLRIKKENLDLYLESGWTKGRIGNGWNNLKRSSMEDVLKKIVLDRENVAVFDRAIAGVLYYKVTTKEGETYEFPVDMNDKEDVGTATFDASIKAATLMRYIRKAIKNNALTTL